MQINWKSLVFGVIYELQPVRISDLFYWCKNIFLILSQCKTLLNETIPWFIKEILPYIKSYLTLSRIWYTIVWFSGFYLMNYFEFGSLWVILSLFALIVYNLGDKEKGDKSWSSYSVFNKGFRNILGALTADQFDREIRHHHPNHTNEDTTPAVAEEDGDSDDGEEVVIDKRHLRRGKKARLRGQAHATTPAAAGRTTENDGRSTRSSSSRYALIQ